MLNEDRAAALENLLILAETDTPVEIVVRDITLTDGLALVDAMTGLRPTIHKDRHVDRIILQVEDGCLKVRAVCFVPIDVTPFNTPPVDLDEDAIVQHRDG